MKDIMNEQSAKMQKILGAGGVTREVLVTASASWTLRFKHNPNLIP